ncbi:MAG: helix-turn-helix domain-containing protein [Ktedonobacteraceae bacterium]
MLQRISSDRALLPTSEACKITGFSSAYIQRLLRQKRIEGVKLGSIWLVYEDSLTSFVAQPRKRGPKGPHKKLERTP